MSILSSLPSVITTELIVRQNFVSEEMFEFLWENADLVAGVYGEPTYDRYIYMTTIKRLIMEGEELEEEGIEEEFKQLFTAENLSKIDKVKLCC